MRAVAVAAVAATLVSGCGPGGAPGPRGLRGQAAALWAARGGFVSPNTNLGLSAYPDGISRSIARSLLEAGGNFRFSLSDLTPAGFGGTEGQGMRRILQQFLARRDAGTTAALLEQAAGRAYCR